MRKLLSIVTIIATVVCFFSACSKPEDSDKIQVVATVFPVYDWTREVIGENDQYELKLLCDNGVDMHSYQPTANDIMAISTCDVFIYVGGESDEWVDDVLSDRKNKDMIIVNLLDVFSDIAIDEGEDEPGAKDEHIWMSIDMAKAVATYLADEVFSLIDSSNTSYSDNATKYCSTLDSMINEYAAVISDARLDTFVVGDRYPFVYLSEEFGINYEAAFDGCSAETNASFETILRLADKLDEISAKYIVVTESADSSIAEAVIDASSNSDIKVIILNSMQSVTKSDIASGTTYLSILSDNLKALALFLN